jgi:hypothetical protein
MSDVKTPSAAVSRPEPAVVDLPKYVSPIVEDNCEAGWTREIEKYAKKVGEESMRYKIAHIAKSVEYTTGYNRLMYVSMILTPLMGLISGINIKLQSDAVPIIILCISFLNSAILSIIKFGKLEEAANTHKTSAAKYSAIAFDVSTQLSMHARFRNNPEKYVKWLSETYNTLFLNSPTTEHVENSSVFVSSDSPDHKKTISTNVSGQNSPLQTFTIEDGRLKYEMNRFLNLNI